MSSHHAGTFQETLDMFESLPEEQQDSLMDILRRRRSEQRREELWRSIDQVEEEYARGEFRRGSSADLMMLPARNGVPVLPEQTVTLEMVNRLRD